MNSGTSAVAAPANSDTPRNRSSVLFQRLLTIFGLAYVVLCLFLPEARRLGWVEVSILVALIVINSDLEKLTLSRDSISIERRVDRVEQKQEGQKQLNDLLIKFVIDMLVTPKEVSLLRKLAADQPAEYSPLDERQLAYLQYELRRLRSLYLLEEKPNRKTGERAGIGKMPQAGDLKELFSITPRGLEFLDLREQLKARLETRVVG